MGMDVGSGGKNARIKPAMNITPLVDVVLVLLIIFMVVTPLLEKELPVRVPEIDNDPTPPDPNDLKDTIVVQLNNGDRLYLNQQELPKDQLLVRLKPMLDNKADADKVVFFDAEDTATYGGAVWLLDTIKQAGANTIGMMLPDPK